VKKRTLFAEILAGLVVAALVSAQPGPPPAQGCDDHAPCTSHPPDHADGNTRGCGEKDAWDKWVEDYYKILKVRKGLEKRVDATHAYPDPRVPALMEIVNEDDEFIYLRNLPLEDPKSAGYQSWALRQKEEARILALNDFLEDKVRPRARRDQCAAAVHRPHPLRGQERGASQTRPLADGVRRRRTSTATGGSTSSSPPRGRGRLTPGSCSTSRRLERCGRDVTWPNIPFDYGDVKVADFDGDGNLDIAIASTSRTRT